MESRVRLARQLAITARVAAFLAESWHQGGLNRQAVLAFIAEFR
jgi:hypothetical protein